MTSEQPVILVLFRVFLGKADYKSGHKLKNLTSTPQTRL